MPADLAETDRIIDNQLAWGMTRNPFKLARVMLKRGAFNLWAIPAILCATIAPFVSAALFPFWTIAAVTEAILDVDSELPSALKLSYTQRWAKTAMRRERARKEQPAAHVVNVPEDDRE